MAERGFISVTAVVASSYNLSFIHNHTADRHFIEFISLLSLCDCLFHISVIIFFKNHLSILH